MILKLQCETKGYFGWAKCDFVTRALKIFFDAVEKMMTSFQEKMIQNNHSLSIVCNKQIQRALISCFTNLFEYLKHQYMKIKFN